MGRYLLLVGVVLCLCAAAVAQVGPPVQPSPGGPQVGPPAQPPAGSQGGAGASSGPPRQVILADLPQATPEELAAHPPIPRPQSGLPPPRERGGARGGPSMVETPENCTPLNLGVAVGPEHMLQAGSAAIRVMDKNGLVLDGFPKSLNAFLGLPAGALTLEPSVLYDCFNGRYVMVVDQLDPVSGVRLLWIATSRDSDPTQGWTVYRVQQP